MPEFVRKLTLQSHRRQRIGAAIGLALAANAFAGHAEAETVWQSNVDITAAAEAFVLDRSGGAADRTSADAAALDPRHRLPQCDRPLQASMRRGTRIGPRTIVGVTCNGSKTWTVYVPVNVYVAGDVMVAARNLPRGHLLTAADLAVDERDVSRMTTGYASSPAELVGQRLKLSLIGGRAITPSMIEADRLIRRGQTVTLLAAGGGIAVSMSGRAMTDGALNQRIRVENVSSGRTIEGIVRSREHVEILLPETADFYSSTPKVSPPSADTLGVQQ